MFFVEVEMGNLQFNRMPVANYGDWTDKFWTDPTNHGLDQSHEGQDLQGKEPQQRSLLHDLRPCALQALHELVSLVHDHINVSDLGQYMVSPSISNSDLNVKDKYGKNMTAKLFCLEDDRVAKILWNLESHAFQEVCLAMAVSFYFLFIVHIEFLFTI